MISLNGKRVTVMGLGLHGGALGNIRWLVEQGAQVTVTDLKSAEELKSTVEKLKGLAGVELVLGEHQEKDFTDTDMVLRNPAVPRTSKYLMLAKDAGVPIEMDSSLFFEFCLSKNIIGVTGSKGKTTTAVFIAELLKAQFPQTVAVGVDGISPLGELKNIQPDSPVVFELSSWRLEALDEKKISPSLAVVTSIYRDHLNTYSSYEDYIETKKVIAKHQKPPDRVLLNADDTILRRWDNSLPGKVFWYSLGEDLPGDGIFIKDGMVRQREAGHEGELLEWRGGSLPGEHTQRNLLPAILIAHWYGISAEQLEVELRRLKPLPHRLEVVRELDGVTYINDSAATMPDATIAALKSLNDKTVVHIVGGSDKELLFEELADAEKQAKLRALIWLPGTATARMQEIFKKAGLDVAPWLDASSMNEAVAAARDAAQAGDTVLLSPGATSFGLFQHEFDRGNQFRAAVLSLK